MSTTSIEWTDRTWNPTRGCSRISPGCVNCYAETIAARFSDEGSPFHLYADRNKSGSKWTGKVGLIEDKLLEPLSWRKPCRCFVNSMSDLWHERMVINDIARVYATMFRASRHTYQILTKRADVRQRTLSDPLFWQLVSQIAGFRCDPAPSFIWEGVSAEDQQRADERIPLLLQTPAAVRFVSYEPALGPVDLRNSPMFWSHPEKLDWIIVGGESGPGARPFNVKWARDMVHQCRDADVACFVKQMGSNPVDGVQARFADKKGGNPEEWPLDLRVREYPQ